jgi:hypothetical protein
MTVLPRTFPPARTIGGARAACASSTLRSCSGSIALRGEQAYRQAVELSDKLARTSDASGIPDHGAGSAASACGIPGKIGRREDALEIAEGRQRRNGQALAQGSLRALSIRGHGYGKLGEWDKAAADLREGDRHPARTT